MALRSLPILGAVALAVACGGGGHTSSSGSGGTHASGGAGGGGSMTGGSGGSSHATGGAGPTGGSAGASQGGSQATGGAGGTGGAAGSTGGASAGSGGASNGGATAGVTGTGRGTGGTAGNSGEAGGAGGTTRAAGGAGGTSDGSAGSTGGTGATGGKLSASDPNVVEIVVDQGPGTGAYINGPFATITLCMPGTSTCQTIDHILVDTGSTGIRVLESVVKLDLPAVTGSSGKSLAECLPFMSGSSWGPVRKADFKMGNEAASNMRVQLIGESTYPMPSTCSGTPITDLDSLGSNGIIGIGIDVEDCGTACASTGRTNPGLYYECASSKSGGCSAAAVSVANQITNPIVSFEQDNNGSFFQFPSIPAAGAKTASGFLVFGIGTRSNNGLGSAKPIPLDSYGFTKTRYPANNGTAYNSFIDSGSNGLYFLDAATSKIATCSTGIWQGYYCPQATVDLTASMTAADGAAVTIDFSVTNPSKLSTSFSAFSNVGAPMFDENSSVSIGFDWGFPFFYGRSVFTAIMGKSTPDGTGPYFAF